MYRVLLVEDEEIIRKGIRYSVPWEECGCSVVGEAENGAVGEEKIAELQPDIVITDITMPVKNGLEMIADTREKFNYMATKYLDKVAVDNFAYTLNLISGTEGVDDLYTIVDSVS